MAERVGFEPTIPGKRDTAFRERGLQPLGNLSGALLVSRCKPVQLACLTLCVNALILVQAVIIA